MQEILKKLMSTRCVSMHNPSMRCYGKGCDGQCPQFQIALNDLEGKICEYLESALKPTLGYYGSVEFVDTFRKVMEE